MNGLGLPRLSKLDRSCVSEMAAVPAAAVTPNHRKASIGEDNYSFFNIFFFFEADSVMAVIGIRFNKEAKVRAVVLFRRTLDICLVCCKRKRNVDIPHFGVALHMCFFECGQGQTKSGRVEQEKQAKNRMCEVGPDDSQLKAHCNTQRARSGDELNENGWMI